VLPMAWWALLVLLWRHCLCPRVILSRRISSANNHAIELTIERAIDEAIAGALE